MHALKSLPILTLIVLVAAPAHGQFGGGLNLSAAASFDMPLGDLDKDAKPGFGILIRSEGRRSGAWGLRTGIAFDRFGGKGEIDNLQMLTFLGGELVHHSEPGWYQFAGIGFYQSRTAVRPEALQQGLTAESITGRVNGGFDFGFQAGVGINYTIGDTHTFLEFGFVNVLTTGRTTSWVPIRLGIRL